MGGVLRNKIGVRVRVRVMVRHGRSPGEPDVLNATKLAEDDIDVIFLDISP